MGVRPERVPQLTTRTILAGQLYWSIKFLRIFKKTGGDTTQLSARFWRSTRTNPGSCSVMACACTRNRRAGKKVYIQITKKRGGRFGRQHRRIVRRSGRIAGKAIRHSYFANRQKRRREGEGGRAVSYLVSREAYLVG